MFEFKNKKIRIKEYTQEKLRRTKINKRMLDAARSSMSNLYDMLGSSCKGLNENEVQIAREKYGDNRITHGKKRSIISDCFSAFINPFTGILIVLAIVSAVTDIFMAEPGESSANTVIIITAMILISGILRFVQEKRSGNAAENLLNMIETTTCVQRESIGKVEIPLEDVVVGDIVHLSAGDMIPADMRIVYAKDLFLSQSALSGESASVEKVSARFKDFEGTVIMAPNLAFMGTNVVSGSAIGIVIATGDDTIFGDIAKTVNQKQPKTTFEKGVSSVSWLLIRFMAVMVPVVLFVNGFTKGDWMEATLFAISVGVGLTPEMLPMIVTTCLAKGAVAMSKEKTIIKNLNSIQNLGSINILCTDKTGTLTQDKVVLQYHLNIDGHDDNRVLKHGFLNSYYQTGLKNLMDVAIIERTKFEKENDSNLAGLSSEYNKIDEIPFDFERRRMSVVVSDSTGKTQMITKGAVEEMLLVSKYAECEGKVMPLTDELKKYILDKVNQLNEDGMRVIAVAQKTNPSPIGAFSVKDESDMVLIGYLAFLDPPKESTSKAIKALNEHGVEVKILTGDNDKVTKCICRQVGIPTDKILLGEDLEQMNDDQLSNVVMNINVFAKLSPQQKTRVIKVLRDKGNSVGYMGDGINDATAMKASDVGISVDTAVDIAKESADVILLEKDLMVLEKGIVEGRKTYANMIKYIKMTASSNFGNMFSVLIASAFLPFIPMMSIHLLLLNLIYDLSCIAIPWDNVDSEYLQSPRKWEAKSIGKFMFWLGPISSIFDISTYLFMYFFICPMMCQGKLFNQISDLAMKDYYIALFQTGWFIESMWSQTTVIHMIRTEKLPFIQSRASLPVIFFTIIALFVSCIIPITFIGKAIGMVQLPYVYFILLVITIALYMVLITIFKKIFIKRYNELL